MTPEAASTTDFGTLDAGGALPVLRFERRLPHPRGKVWRALTEPEQLAAWFPTTIEGERAAGAPLRFSFEGIEIEPMQGQMHRFDPEELIEFGWGPDTVRFELADDGDGTLLTLIVGLEELGKAARDGAGWHTCLDNLGDALAGVPVDRDTSTRWREVHPTYVSAFGAAASTLGPPEEWEAVHGEA